MSIFPGHLAVAIAMDTTVPAHIPLPPGLQPQIARPPGGGESVIIIRVQVLLLLFGFYHASNSVPPVPVPSPFPVPPPVPRRS